MLDRLSFQRFAGCVIELNSELHHNLEFKERRIKIGASRRVFDAVNRQYARHRYFSRGGQMVNTYIV
ncbi:hypothetical protein [Pseudoduganella lutea]|uniref:Uncharacterized protein n=1 Tax=Pseudoduganella lutea TaxID=321985 RepID=A0A4P6KU84_9BURK|nr:hypothetical protein [Pseudoduganella lutea]QBE62367.1 hypothetical protein EWM63_04690 [Pseudoduganella lutea]